MLSEKGSELLVHEGFKYEKVQRKVEKRDCVLRKTCAAHVFMDNFFLDTMSGL